jgi:hypothetical protein
MPEPMPTVLQHWRFPTDVYNQPVAGQYSVAAWLPRLGPTSWLLWSTLASQVYVNGPGITVDLVEVAEALGIGQPGRHGWALTGALKRLRNYRVAKPVAGEDQALQVRVFAPPVTPRAYERLAPDARKLHLEIFGVSTAQIGLASSH